MRNPFTKTALRDLILRVSNPGRRIILDDINRLRAEIQGGEARAAEMRAELNRAREEIGALHIAMVEIAGRIGALQEVEQRTTGRLRDGFDSVQETLRQNHEDLAPYLPRRRHESFDVGHFARLRAAETSADLFSAYLYDKPVFDRAEDLIAHCLGLLNGQIRLPLEFGVFSGRTINAIADILGPEITVYGFDSFEGLPETWRSNFCEGHFAMANLPEVRPNIRLVKGWFNDVLPSFRDDVMGKARTNFIHVDCDLYSSTRTILADLADHIADDAILVFDEYFNYPGWEQHEYRAFMEYLKASGRSFDYLGSVPVHQQVAVRLRPSAKG